MTCWRTLSRFSPFNTDQALALIRMMADHPDVTANLGVRWDTEQFFGFSPTRPSANSGVRPDQSVVARVSLVWDWAGDGTSNPLLATFFSSRPTSTSRVHGQLGAQTYATTPSSRSERARARTAGRQRLRRARGWLDEAKERNPAHQGVLPGRLTLGVEGSRSDALHRPQGHLPHPPHGRRPL
jgi:hypothetical protein